MAISPPLTLPEECQWRTVYTATICLTLLFELLLPRDHVPHASDSIRANSCLDHIHEAASCLDMINASYAALGSFREVRDPQVVQLFLQTMQVQTTRGHLLEMSRLRLH